MTWQDLFNQHSRVSPDKLRWWLSDRLNLPLTRLPMAAEPDENLRRDFEYATERLAAGEPVQYICGRAPFRDLELRVDRRVLIPRPETEQLVQIALDRIIHPGDRVLDVGTGSGCIALSVKYACPDCHVEGRDLSADALQVALNNARDLKIDVRFKQADLLTAEADQSWDVILANLPYIGETERAALPEDVREYEPALALFAGTDGTDLVVDLMRQARRVLAPGGRILLETGETQHAVYAQAAREFGWHLHPLEDLAGRERFQLLTRSAGPTT